MTQKFYCKYCGISTFWADNLAKEACVKNPVTGLKNHHELYEGGEKASYTCKHCGIKKPSIAKLTAYHCPQSPQGKLKGWHEPAI